MKRKPKIVLPAKYILLILTVVCVAAMITSFTLNISGGPLNAVAGYVFVPMQRGINTVGAWITEKADNLKNLSDVMAENDALKKQVDELTSELNTNNLEQYELEKANLYSGGYKIYTALDTTKQEALQEILDDELSFDREVNSDSEIYALQGAVTVIDNDTGKVVDVRRTAFPRPTV